MKRYLVYHTLPAGLTGDQVQEIARSTQGTPGIRGLHSYLNLTECAGVCVFEAASREPLERFFKDHNVPFDRIVPIEWEGDRGKMVEVRTLETAGV